MKKKIRVLVVDDEEAFALNICRLLSSRGFEASAAFDGDTAIDTIKKSSGKFDAVVLDVKMPGMDGIETLIGIKKIDPEIEVIMLTGHASIDSGIQAICEGAYDYLMKPCDINNLAEKLQEAFQVKDIKSHPVLWPRKLVKEIVLTGFIRLEAGDQLIKSVEIFQKLNRGAIKEELHVLGRKDRLVGVITRIDLVDEAQYRHPEISCSWDELVSHPEWLSNKTIAEVMRPAPRIFAVPEEKLTLVARRMIHQKLRYLPVLEDQRLVGIIRLKDVLQHVAREEEKAL